MKAPPQADQPVLCIAGPTASGKTAAALQIAEQARRQGESVELISMDSALVYRGMNIGTAKPSLEERAQVPHHLLDILDPAQPYSAAQFAADARRLIDDIRRRGARPVIVGGTMLYLKALQSGLAELPQADPTVRAEIDAEAARLGWPALHVRLAEVDPVTAARLAPHDAQRIQRALEVWRLSGKPLSAHFADGPSAQPPQAPSGGPPLRLLSLEPSDRGVLHERIARRFDQMLAAGFLDEVQSLRQRGDLSPALPSIRAVGYRQAWQFLDGSIDAAQFRDQAIAATRQLAKRQITWLRSMPQREIHDCLKPLQIQVF
ncbi:tRNA (adenosine(37)-N6)-dimethylallyltransferase MiaA [Thiomonas bhubaneswarensis]|uniref:tRNA dimethylallyltransferase n=1 Tax=Thiomonas bhubaneswarensis TaxID=339866 RepID=A0A0K6I6G4_9BURK|nr:tRNA (adenosine(37)-N6)-dimethylallyltransferase MiaA [Thiomonas bhubaneswarensis]CUA98734.1 tRNA dimethylallyltransferase [Thiomonas bhubaneswarensis]